MILWQKLCHKLRAPNYVLDRFGRLSKMTNKIVYKRALLKLSGEALGGPAGQGYDTEVINKMATDIAILSKLGVELGIVVGGGNFFRGLASGLPGCDRVGADHIGMLATVMNALAIGHAIRGHGVNVSVLSSIPIDSLVEGFSAKKARTRISQGEVVVFGGGTGNPLFTTDSAAALRAVECDADILIKATRVNGVYSADPEKYPEATRFQALSFSEIIEKRLAVMDTTAFAMCEESKMPIRVIDLAREDSIKKVVFGLDEGTLIH
jgi:uridylate kinase